MSKKNILAESVKVEYANPQPCCCEATFTFAADAVKAENVEGTVDSAKKAEKLGTSNIGSSEKPMYLENGVAKECTYSLNTNVPANAKFTDTTYNTATQSADGLMSSTDKKKLDEIEIAITGTQLVINFV